MAELEPALLAALEEGLPDEREAALQASVTSARAALASAREVLASAELEHARALAARDEATQRLGELEVAHRHAQEALATMVAELRLASPDALANALVPLPEVARLSELAARLHADWASASALYQGALAEHAAHEAAWTGAHPRDEGELGQLLAVAIDAAAAASQRVGACRSALAADEAQRAKRRALDERATAARAERDLADRLYRLVGVGDGAELQRYAQLQNLALLIAKANDQLRELAPRYALVPAENAHGAKLLAFQVTDRWQADRPRPLTTLSGGETFLVSLGLALALADVRSIRMPVETLLLDEGFGTLDRDTLGTALQALGSLGARSIQVGVVSHVEGLRDAIPTHVVVTPQGGGRSRVHIEQVRAQ